MYYVNYNGQTSDGRCIDNSDINTLQELVYNSTPCYRALYVHNLVGQRHHDSIQDVSSYEMIHPRHRRRLERQYSDEQLVWTHTATSTTSGSAT